MRSISNYLWDKNCFWIQLTLKHCTALGWNQDHRFSKLSTCIHEVPHVMLRYSNEPLTATLGEGIRPRSCPIALHPMKILDESDGAQMQNGQKLLHFYQPKVARKCPLFCSKLNYNFEGTFKISFMKSVFFFQYSGSTSFFFLFFGTTPNNIYVPQAVSALSLDGAYNTTLNSITYSYDIKCTRGKEESQLSDWKK